MRGANSLRLRSHTQEDGWCPAPQRSQRAFSLWDRDSHRRPCAESSIMSPPRTGDMCQVSVSGSTALPKTTGSLSANKYDKYNLITTFFSLCLGF